MKNESFIPDRLIHAGAPVGRTEALGQSKEFLEFQEAEELIKGAMTILYPLTSRRVKEIKRVIN